jgi:hypothetical protein
MEVRDAFPTWDEPDPEKIRIQAEKRKIFEEKRAEFIKKYGLIKLKSDYLNMSSYYLDKNKVMYEVENTKDNFNYRVINDQHIFKLNKIL